MKKIIALAMSALLAVSAVALPVSAQPAVPGINQVLSGQTRPVTAEELAQVRGKAVATEEAISGGVVTETLVAQVEQSLAAADAKAVTGIPQPVLAHVTASTIVFEKVDGYEYGVSDGYWSKESKSNIVYNLEPNTEYQCYLYRTGNPLAPGESITVVTADRVPCLNTPKAPMVKEHTHNSITLEDRVGYEYRIEGGTWQSSPVFTGLEPETEYTFYQRIKLSSTELASEESQPLVAKTGFVGPSTAINMAKLRSFIDANGFVDEDGYKTVAFVITDEYATEYYFLMVMREDNILFDVFSYSEEPDVLLFNTEFPLGSNTCVLMLEFSAALYADNECVDYTENSMYPYLNEYKIGDPVTNVASSAYLTSQDLCSLWTMTSEMLFSFWDEFLYTTFGFGFRGLGFVATEGYGDLFCHGPLQAHFGETELLYAREAECDVDASNGEAYCTLCGQHIKDFSKEPSFGNHRYSGCNAQCDHCDMLRVVPHMYTFACDTKCNYCGLVRTEPFAAHTYDENGFCAKCGEKQPLPGDINGDGKVNMGDVSRAYAHAKGSTLLTDPNALVAADTSGDGKINLGDVTRIYAHITGKKPLW
jgi:hypothetical protein